LGKDSLLGQILRKLTKLASLLKTELLIDLIWD